MSRSKRQIGVVVASPRTETRPRETESGIQDAIRQYLRLHGWFVYRNHQTLGSHKELADLTAVKGGRVLWIEVKTSKGELSDYQVRFAEDITSHGGEYIVARSVDDVEAYLEGVGRRCG